MDGKKIEAEVLIDKIRIRVRAQTRRDAHLRISISSFTFASRPWPDT